MKSSKLTCAFLFALTMPLSALAGPIVEGKRVFEMSCSVGYCHGLEGRAGKGPRLRDRVWSKDYLYSTIKNGIPNSSMPAWKGRLTSASIDAVVAYILSISSQQPAPEIAESKTPSVHTSEAVEIDANSGAELFFDPLKDSNCGTCHRVAGRGTPVARDFPKLTNRSEQALLKQVETQPPHPSPVRVTIKDGGDVCGIKVDEIGPTLHIYDLTGPGPPVLRTIDRELIASEASCVDLNVHGNNSRTYTRLELVRIIAFLRSIQ